jgi:hypothetical protein
MRGFGERLRVPVQAMLNRIDSNGRVSPYCELAFRQARGNKIAIAALRDVRTRCAS